MRNDLFAMYWAQQNSDPLPKEYRRVEYLESTGEQWIDTGYVPRVRDSMHVIATRLSGADNTLIGLKTSAYYYMCKFSDLGSAAADMCLSSPLITINPPIVGAGHKYSFYIDEETAVLYRDDELVFRKSTTYTETTYNITAFLFAKNENNEVVAQKARCRMYIARIGNKRSYIPCVRIADNKPGMYDLCGSVCPLTRTPFYVNAGTGQDFTWGELS